jgi:hypothetical protein
MSAYHDALERENEDLREALDLCVWALKQWEAEIPIVHPVLQGARINGEEVLKK